jgi:hypothetical protein
LLCLHSKQDMPAETKGVYESKKGANITHSKSNIAQSNPVKVIIPCSFCDS